MADIFRVDCPVMKTYKIDANTRKTAPIRSLNYLNGVIHSYFDWPECLIKKVRLGYWLVDEVTAKAPDGSYVHLQKEVNIFNIALKVAAIGRININSISKGINGYFPWCYALPLGSGIWQVCAVSASLTVGD